MKPNLRQRNVALNSYMSMLVVTVVGGFAVLYIIHVANDVPFTAFAAPQTYAIDSNL